MGQQDFWMSEVECELNKNAFQLHCYSASRRSAVHTCHTLYSVHSDKELYSVVSQHWVLYFHIDISFVNH